MTKVGDGQPVHLQTDFHAVVDGTNGDTLLDPVKARFLNSVVVAQGGVRKQKGHDGKSIQLDVTIDQARIEDLISLVVGKNPPITGDIHAQTAFELPAREGPVLDRLLLNGHFSLEEAEFTGGETRKKMEELSWRARGRPDQKEDEQSRMVSALRSKFTLADATLTLSGLSFRIPGAVIHLDGTYNIPQEKLDFTGELRMQAEVSEAVGGIKSIFLKLLDPFFKKDGAGAVVPIKVEGTLDEPEFGIDF